LLWRRPKRYAFDFAVEGNCMVAGYFVEYSALTFGLILFWLNAPI
jgi:NADH:ubiquinone oxidoreductase subunit H